MRDITLEDTFYQTFTTRAFATGIPGTLGGTPVVSAYENDSVTQITAGITLGVDHDSVAGLNLLTVVATAANGYEAGKDYSLVITTGTVGGVSVVGEQVAEFSIGRSAAAVDLANGTDGLTAIKGDTAATLTDTNEIQGKLPTNKFMGSSDGADDDGNIAAILTDTNELQTDDVPGLIAALNDISAADVLAQVIQGLKNTGLVLSSSTIETVTNQTNFVIPATDDAPDDDSYNDLTAVFIDGSDPNQRSVRSVIDYTGGATRSVQVDAAPDFTVTTADTLILLSTSNARAIWNRLLSGSTHNITSTSGKILRQLQTNQGYLGNVHIDTIGGTAGTDAFEHGTIGIPVLTLADALTIAAIAEVNLDSFLLRPASSITFISTISAKVFKGLDTWTLALGGQDISNSAFFGAEVSGVATGTGTQRFRDCDLGAVTFPADTHVENCWIEGDQTLLAGEYFYHNCHSHLAGPVLAPVFDFGVGVGDTSLNLRDYSGGVDIRNMGHTGTDTMTLEGHGQLIINANCIGGTIGLRGKFEVTDNSGGAVTIVKDDDSDALADIQSRLPASLVSGRMDASVGAMAAAVLTAAAIATNAITAAKIAADAIGSSELATTAVNEIRDAIFQGVLTEGYSSVNAAPTLEEAMYEIMQSVGDFEVTGTTLTVRKRDGTTAMTYTLDDGTDPTDRARTT